MVVGRLADLENCRVSFEVGFFFEWPTAKFNSKRLRGCWPLANKTDCKSAVLKLSRRESGECLAHASGFHFDGLGRPLYGTPRPILAAVRVNADVRQ
ncbi:hypothetical protein RB7080 [Rhodopirellula baltica SH 1]|uniref:Uncharacterized protein n=1 Tax=Rhodopirellula baltica (strain DSM 10527 / NCIMB 13988 / SH1) TaxID=243090 RepID=Q7UP99_RHOBA|nr:hypothetical protein RB7080 [Rhodopirellula baltica SH 1]